MFTGFTVLFILSCEYYSFLYYHLFLYIFVYVVYIFYEKTADSISFSTFLVRNKGTAYDWSCLFLLFICRLPAA